jgi:colicin import membrane protein
VKIFDRSEPGAWVSGAAHAAILAAAIVGLSWDRLPDAEEGIAVEVVTDNQFAEMTRGERQAETVQPELKPRAERVAETPEERPPGEASRDVPSPPTRPPEMTVAEREVAAPPPPPPPPMPPRREVAKVEPPLAPPRREVERKPEAKAEPKREELAKLVEREAEEAEAKAAAEREKAAADAKARAEAQARQKAESEARERAKAEAKALAEAKERARIEAEAKAVAEAKLQAEIKAKQEAEARAKREAEVADRFNPGDIRKLLGLKEPAQSTGSTGREVQRTAALGTATGNAQRLNPSQLGALKALLQDQIRNNYLEVPGSKNDAVTIPVLQIRLNRDGSLAAEPRLLRVGPKPIDRAVAEAALRAVRRSAPFRIPAQYAPFYEDWKELNPEFTAE